MQISGEQIEENCRRLRRITKFENWEWITGHCLKEKHRPLHTYLTQASQGKKDSRRLICLLEWLWMSLRP